MNLPENRPETGRDEVLRLLTVILALVAVVCATMVFGYTIYVVAWGFSYWEIVLRDHFVTIIGLPGAAAVAFALAVFLRQTDGPLEFEGLGIKVKGAAGQVLLWVVCFLAIAAAVRLTWKI